MLGVALNSSNPVITPRLAVGMDSGDQGKSVVNFGAMPSNYVDTFTVNAKGLFSVTTEGIPANIQSIGGDMNIQSTGGAGVRTRLLSTGQTILEAPFGISQTAISGNLLMFAGTASFALLYANNTIAGSATNVTFLTPYFTVARTETEVWMQTQLTTNVCQGGLPSSTSGMSMSFPTDVIFGGNLLTNSTTGLLSMPGISLCGTTIETQGSTLILQNSTNTKTVDVRAVITNSEPGMAVTIIDSANGVNFQETALHNEGGVLPEPLKCDDEQGFELTKQNATLYANFFDHGVNASVMTFVNDTVFNTQIRVNNVYPQSGTTVTINGDLFVTGSVSATGACCTSDSRVKEHVEHVREEDDLRTIMSLPRRVRFRYIEAYRSVDRFMTDHVQDGFIAQEIEQVLPSIVHRVNQTVGHIRYTDFRKLVYDRLVPHVVGAVKALHIKDHILQAEHAALKTAHDKLQQEFHAFKQWVANKLN
jgi:hypothetical protein